MPRFVLGRTTAAAAMLTCGLVAAAQACKPTGPTSASPPPTVCNQASPHFQGGTLDAQDPPVRQPAARYHHHLKPMPGHGRGLPGAASHSPSLTICGPGSDDGGGTTSTSSDGGMTTPTTPTIPTTPTTPTAPTDNGGHHQHGGTSGTGGDTTGGSTGTSGGTTGGGTS